MVVDRNADRAETPRWRDAARPDRQAQLALGWAALACAAVVVGGVVRYDVDGFAGFADPSPIAVAAVAFAVAALLGAAARLAGDLPWAGLAGGGRLAALGAFLLVFLRRDAFGVVALLGAAAWLVGDQRRTGLVRWGQLAAPVALALVVRGGYAGWTIGLWPLAGLGGLVASAAGLWLDARRGASGWATLAGVLLLLVIAAVLLFVLLLMGTQ